MSCLPPDIAALAGLYGIEPREDGLSVPQRVEDTWTSANHASTEEPPLTMERVREAMERMRDDGLSVRPPKRMAPRSRSLSAIARLRWVAQKTAERFGIVMWVDRHRRPPMFIHQPDGNITTYLVPVCDEWEPRDD